jgi:hypothetical protein
MYVEDTERIRSVVDSGTEDYMIIEPEIPMVLRRPFP